MLYSMLKLGVFCIFVACCNAEWFEDSYAKYAGQHGNWETRYHSQFAGWSLDKVKTLMGTKLGGKPGTPIKEVENVDVLSIPASFDCRNKWPQCAGTFDYIKDQAGCGSCWAVSASNVIAGRVCIGNVKQGEQLNSPSPMFLNEPAPPIDFSSQQIMSCCSWCGDGCQGGYPIDAMRYWAMTGVVTGGWYGSNCGCYPYEIPPCGPGGCSEGPTPRCKTSCRSGYPVSYNSDKHVGTNHYQIAKDVTQLQNEIMNHGPIECGFTVYEDFMHYSSGVYDKCTHHWWDRKLGGHAVTCYGWGTQNGVPYWIFHNSWNVTWGMQGKFNIKRGVNCVGIEAECVAGIAKTSDSGYNLKC